MRRAPGSWRHPTGEQDPAYPLGPVMEGMGVNITVLSASDEFCVGIIADAELVDDVGELGDRFVAAIRELHELALAAG